MDCERDSIVRVAHDEMRSPFRLRNTFAQLAHLHSAKGFEMSSGSSSSSSSLAVRNSKRIKRSESSN